MVYVPCAVGLGAWLTLPDSFTLWCASLVLVHPWLTLPDSFTLWCASLVLVHPWLTLPYYSACPLCSWSWCMADFARQLYSMVYVPCAVGLGAWLTLPDSFTLWCTSLVQLVLVEDMFYSLWCPLCSCS